MRATMRLIGIGLMTAALFSPAVGEAQEKTLKVVAWGGAS